MTITCKRVKTINEFIDAIRIRADVFIVEQGSEPGWEPDEEDKMARQYIALIDGTIVATARTREDPKNCVKIERMATKKEYRKKNISKTLLEFIIKEEMKEKPEKIWGACQVQAQGFYEKNGFVVISKPYDQYGIEHVDMEWKG
jgi:predicted GNAT family N-acyltransferase